MLLRFSFFLFLSLLLVVGCDRDPIDITTSIPGELPPTDSLTSTTSLAGTVRNPDGTFPSNATAEVLYGDFVIHSQRVNSGDGTWFFNDIAVSDDPNVLVRITAPGWVPAVRSIPNRSDVVRYSNVVLLDRGRTDFVNQFDDYTETSGLLTVTVPSNSYADQPFDQGVEISLNSYVGDEITTLGDAIAAPLLVDDGGTLKSLSNPTVYALVVTDADGRNIKFNKLLNRGIELSTINAGPTSIIYTLNQETGYWENISTPNGLLEIKQFGYIAVAQLSNSVRLSGRIEQPDGTGIAGGSVYALVMDANGSPAFDVSATDGNGEYELLVPSGSSGTVFLKPPACGEETYTISDQTVDLALGTFTTGVGTQLLMEGLVEGCAAGVGSTEDLAIEITSASIGRELIPVASDGTFSYVREVCPLEDVTFVPVVQSGPSVGRQGSRLVVTDGDPLQGLRLQFCDTLVSDALMFMNFQSTTVFTTTPVGTTIHPDTIEVIGETMAPQGEMRWIVAFNDQGLPPQVKVMYTDADQSYESDAFVEAIGLTYDGFQLDFTFVDAPGTLTNLSAGSTESRDSGGGVRVKVD